jgi:tetratricopeptide (TPR) repeat protein
MGVLLAFLLASDTVLVVPFVPRGDAPPAAGIAVAEAVVDVVVQSNRDNFLTLKQLDAVLRRRDLRLDDWAVAARALELARPLGATDVVTGEVWLDEGQFRIAARRTKVGESRPVVEAKEEGPRSALPALAQKIGVDLFGAPAAVVGPLTGSAAALEQAALCWKHLARQSLGAHSPITLQPDRRAAAERACRAALQADPRLGLARAGLAVTLAARGKFAQARKQARRAQTRRFVPLAVLAESFAARKMHDAAGWRATLEAAVIARRGFLHALGYLAEDRMEAGDDEAALAIFDRYLQLSPNHPWAMGNKGRELARAGRMDEAIAISEKALAIDPANPELQVEAASRYIDAGHDAKALPLLDQALKATPPRPTAALRLGYVYLRGDNLPLAREALEQCLQLATREDEARTRGIAHADLAIVSARQEQYGEAVIELQKARGEGNNHLPCEEPELRRWKERPELREVCVAAEAALADGDEDEDAVPVEL